MSKIELNFSQEAGNNLVQPTINITIDFLNEWRNKFKINLNRISKVVQEQESILIRLRNIANTNQKLKNLSDKELAEVLLRKNSEENVEFSEARKILKELEEEYKNTYENINKFRAEFFLPINYSYAFEFEGEVYEVNNLTFEDIAPLISLQLNSRVKTLDNIFKLRFAPSKMLLENFIQSHKNKVNTIKSKNIKKGSSVWSQLEKIHQAWGNNLSRGQFYEAYRSILHTYKKNNKKDQLPPPNEEEILAIFIEVKKNNLSWVRGGDVENEQDKFMNASLTSAKSLITTLNDLINFLSIENLNKETIASNIARIFGNQNFNAKVLSKARQEALDKLTQEIKQNIIIS